MYMHKTEDFFFGLAIGGIIKTNLCALSMLKMVSWGKFVWEKCHPVMTGGMSPIIHSKKMKEVLACGLSGHCWNW